VSDIDRIAIALAIALETRGNMMTTGGSVKIFIDNMRLYLPIDTAEE